MEQVLEKLFGSVPRIRLIKLFVRNPGVGFTLAGVLKKSQCKSPSVRPELRKLEEIGLIKKRVATPKIPGTRKPKKTLIYYTNEAFPLLEELRNLIAKYSFTYRKSLLKKVHELGKVKLAVISGIFINSDRSRTDLLIVGDNLKRGRMDKFLSHLELELGKSLQYTVMDSKEFEYRKTMYDRFLRDILEFPHEKLINKIKI